MRKDTLSLVEDVKTYSKGLILSIEEGKIQESMNYVKKMRDHLTKVQEYLEMKKSIS